MISNQQVIEQAKSVLTPTVRTTESAYHSIDKLLIDLRELTHI